MPDDALAGARGDGSPVASPGGTQATVPGGQTPANPGSAVEAKLDALLAENASMRETLKRLEDDRQARLRRERTGRGDPPAMPASPAAGAASDGEIDTTKIPDDATRSAVAGLVQRERAREANERAAAEQAKKDRAKTELKALLDAASPPRRARAEATLSPHVKVGIDGTVIYDDGKTVCSIEEAVRQELADEIYRPVPIVPGTGTPQGLPPRYAGQKTPKQLELEEAANIESAEARYRRQRDIERKYAGA